MTNMLTFNVNSINSQTILKKIYKYMAQAYDLIDQGLLTESAYGVGSYSICGFSQ